MLKDLNFSRCRRWILDARDKQESDPVYAFIALWIGFNYYYGTFASSNRTDFHKYSKGKKGDKVQWNYLIARKEFAKFFAAFRAAQKELFEIEINLPIMDLLFNRSIPENVKRGKYKLRDLQTEQIFQIIYQIRNNLFHGNKDPFVNERDKRLSKFGSQFMLLFLSTLLTNTGGEVLDLDDDKQQKEIKDIADIAKMPS